MSEKKRYRVWWEWLNGETSGIVENKIDSSTYVIRVANGKQVIIHKKSIKRWEELQSE